MGGNPLKKKIFGILIYTILIAATVIPVSSIDTQKPGNFTLQPPIEWEKTYGRELVDWGRCVQQTSDGGYILSGACDRYVYTPCQGYIYLLKIDAMGNIEWQQQYGIIPYENVGQYIQPSSDGGYIIAGFTGYNYHFDAYILKTDSSGAFTWTRTLGLFNYYDDSLSVQQTTDEGYILTGWTGSYGAGSSDVWLIKLNAVGVDEWIQTFGGNGLDGGDCVQQTSDGGYIIAGSTHSFDSGGNGDIWLIKTDANGNELWNKSFGGMYLDTGKYVQQTLDGGYIITGGTSSFSMGNDDVWLIKTDSNGNELWNSTFGGSNWDQGKSIVQTADDGYFITGDYTDPVHEDLELYMIKTDENGNEEWSYIIDHNGETDSGSYGIQTNDGGYIITGETGKYNLAAVDVLLIKLQGTNTPPNKPTINGDSKGKPGIEYHFTFNTIDLEGDDVYYWIDWGDDINSGWIGSYSSGEEVVVGHTWFEKGTYVIRAKAKDGLGAEGDWTTFSVTMPCSYNIPYIQFLMRLLERFPHAFPLLQHLLQY
ncbi:hypothetical protein AYK25_01660 [Thermoplasmatales archaeon SM1-50]|nr:MAG: hypothetical protein AYK25_01660 [Thermoplasmatales archaeon SM1-50]